MNKKSQFDATAERLPYHFSSFSIIASLSTSYSWENLELFSAFRSLMRLKSSSTVIGGWSIMAGVWKVILFNSTGSDGSFFSSSTFFGFLSPLRLLLEWKRVHLKLSIIIWACDFTSLGNLWFTLLHLHINSTLCLSHLLQKNTAIATSAVITTTATTGMMMKVKFIPPPVCGSGSFIAWLFPPVSALSPNKKQQHCVRTRQRHPSIKP